jgi:hypothetical protein
MLQQLLPQPPPPTPHTCSHAENGLTEDVAAGVPTARQAHNDVRESHGGQLIVEVNGERHVCLDGCHIQARSKGHDKELQQQGRQNGRPQSAGQDTEVT